MKVFAPKRAVIMTTASDYETGVRGSVILPYEGEWVDVEDYFHQITGGNDINDVIHAKVVDAHENPISVSAGVINGLPVLTSLHESGRYLWYTGVAYEVVKRQEYRMPKNYKGKKKIEPRLYTWYERIPLPYVLKVFMIGHKSPSWNYGNRCTFEVYGTKPAQRSDGTRYVRYGSMRWEAAQNPDGQHVYYNSTHKESGERPWNFFWVDMSGFGGILSSWESRKAMNWEQAASEFFSDIIPYFAQPGRMCAILKHIYEDPSAGSRATPYPVDGREFPSPEYLSKAFLLNEPEIHYAKMDPMLLGKDLEFKNYWSNYLMQHALLEACESFPKLSDNSISNVMEIVGFVKALVVDHKIEIPRSLQSAWLAYRYQFTTTKADVKEAVKFVRRHSDLGDLTRPISCYGTSSTMYKDTLVTCRCSIDIEPRNLKTLDRIMRALDTYGLTPDFYVIWDMIPYSFIVDWFLPIGDILATLDADAKYFSGEFYNLKNLCYSFSYNRELDDGNVVKCYTRWRGSVPTCLNSFYWFEPPSASDKTVVYRILDALSLFIGR